MTSIEATAPIPVIDPSASTPLEQRVAAVVFDDPVVGRLVSSTQRNKARLFRYGVTSILALLLSEVVLLVLDNVGLNAGLAAIVANVAGTLPSYLLSRYWIWAEAERDQTGRQILLYWTVSFISMGISSGTIDLVAAHSPRHHLGKLVVLGTTYLITSFALWIAKFVAYQKVIFPMSSRRVESIATT